jgi:hypothetical protein
MHESNESADGADPGPATNGASKNRFEPVGEIVSIFRRGRTWYANYQVNGRQKRVWSRSLRFVVPFRRRGRDRYSPLFGVGSVGTNSGTGLSVGGGV